MPPETTSVCSHRIWRRCDKSTPIIIIDCNKPDNLTISCLPFSGQQQYQASSTCQPFHFFSHQFLSYIYFSHPQHAYRSQPAGGSRRYLFCYFPPFHLHEQRIINTERRKSAWWQLFFFSPFLITVFWWTVCQLFFPGAFPTTHLHETDLIRHGTQKDKETKDWASNCYHLTQPNITYTHIFLRGTHDVNMNSISSPTSQPGYDKVVNMKVKPKAMNRGGLQSSHYLCQDI